MRLSIISFSAKGKTLSQTIYEKLKDTAGLEISLYSKCSSGVDPAEAAGHMDTGDADDSFASTVHPAEGSIFQWAGCRMEQKNAILFIGACGIAVRTIAPFVTDKLHDSPVLVMDERGKYIIPILSGHIGGANELALLISVKTGAEPVITTATDINNRFAIDVFAGKNNLTILNKDGIKKVSAKVLAGHKITISITRHNKTAITK